MYFRAKEALDAAAVESDRLFALVGGDNAPDGSPAHAAYTARRAAVGYDAAMEYEDELYDARCDAEDAVYRFAPTSLADVEAKARVLIAHNDLDDMDFGVEAFIRSLLREAA